MYDMKKLEKIATLNESAPDAMKAFWSFDQEAFKPGSIDALHKQLIGIAVALTTQCPYCLEFHLDVARKAGATDAMLAETAAVAAAMRAGAAITHASHLFNS